MKYSNCTIKLRYKDYNIEKISDKIYKSDYGYFLNKEKEWAFIPVEKDFNVEILMIITDILRNLNELPRIY